MKDKIYRIFLLPISVLSVLLVLFTSCARVEIEIGLPNTKQVSTIQTGREAIVLLRVTGNFDDGTRVGTFGGSNEAKNVNLGLYKDGPQGEVELVRLQRFLSSETKDQGWTYFIMKPGTYYFAFIGLCSYMSLPGKEECDHRLERARLWQVDIPKDAPIVYIGSMNLQSWREYARLGDLISDFDENKMLLQNEENLAKQLAASYLSEFGPIHTVLMKPQDELKMGIANLKNVKHLLEPAREMQQEYWTPNPDEKEGLLEKGIDQLTWKESLRLLHLACLEMLTESPCREQLMNFGAERGEIQPGENRDLILRLVKRIGSEDSPYKPRFVSVYQWKPGASAEREPDMQGLFYNFSLTHLGSIEVIRLDDKQQPIELSFISLDELHRAFILPAPGPYRYAEFEFSDGRPKEWMLLPLQYGISWMTQNTMDHDGTFTRWICGLKTVMDKQLQLPGLGVGQQDYLISEGENRRMFGLGSIAVLMVALSTDDPKFGQKCKALGINPEEIRRSIEKDLEVQ